VDSMFREMSSPLQVFIFTWTTLKLLKLLMEVRTIIALVPGVSHWRESQIIYNSYFRTCNW
jgi:hypothetical protein